MRRRPSSTMSMPCARPSSSAHGVEHHRHAARRRIRALRGWARIYPVAQPLADYYSAREAWLSDRDEKATELFERARHGARSRGLGHYERLGAEAIEARRRSRSALRFAAESRAAQGAGALDHGGQGLQVAVGEEHC